MPTAVMVILIILAVVAALFLITFIVYFFNLDSKMLTALAPFFEKHYDKRRRNRGL